MNRRYIVLKKEYCHLDELTGMWTFKLPDDFVNSRSDNKRITVMNFMYYATWIPRTEGTININCGKICIGEGAADSIVLGSKLMEKFNSHTHFSGDAPVTNPPIEKLQPSDFSRTIKIK